MLTPTSGRISASWWRALAARSLSLCAAIPSSISLNPRPASTPRSATQTRGPAAVLVGRAAAEARTSHSLYSAFVRMDMNLSMPTRSRVY